jgi:hypothetical protein
MKSTCPSCYKDFEWIKDGPDFCPKCWAPVLAEYTAVLTSGVPSGSLRKIRDGVWSISEGSGIVRHVWGPKNATPEEVWAEVCAQMTPGTGNPWGEE